MNIRPYLISAVGTALDQDQRLHVDGMRQHLEDQWTHGIDGVLVAGTMGCLQLLRDETYEELAICAVEHSRGCGELLIGAGDASLARTRERIEFLNGLSIDGAVVLCPYFIHFNQGELIDYFQNLADLSRHPLYLYHLPALTHAALELETVERLSEHPNIRGIKCSCDLAWSLELIRRVSPEFRVIIASATRVEELARQNIVEHLDGIFALAPKWTASLGRACRDGDWRLASHYQSLINQLLEIIQRMAVFPAFSAILNAQGVQGCFAPKPFRSLSEQNLQRLLEQPIVQQLVSDRDPTPPIQTDGASPRLG